LYFESFVTSSLWILLNYKGPSAKYQVQSSKYKAQSSKYKAQSTKLKVPSTFFCGTTIAQETPERKSLAVRISVRLDYLFKGGLNNGADSIDNSGLAAPGRVAVVGL
jgi:hypothetical protein